MRYLASLQFDGTAYHGWQIQSNGDSVQERVQQSLSTLLRKTVEVVGAGRTDSGVHARHLPCHFDVEGELEVEQLCHRLNKILPQDIACHDIRPVSDDLHARFSAVRRTYRYFIHTSKNPFLRTQSVETHWPLDFELMNEGARFLLTVQDFRAFCKAGADCKTTLCQVSKAEWVAMGEGRWFFEVTANRFLRNMVRAIVGTLFELGRHRITLEQMKDIVLHGTRSDAGESMPARGLFLWQVDYDLPPTKDI